MSPLLSFRCRSQRSVCLLAKPGSAAIIASLAFLSTCIPQYPSTIYHGFLKTRIHNTLSYTIKAYVQRMNSIVLRKFSFAQCLCYQGLHESNSSGSNSISETYPSPVPAVFEPMITVSFAFWPHNRKPCLLQFESIAGFGAIIDRLGQFSEVLEPFGVSPMTQQSEIAGSQTSQSHTEPSRISLEDLEPSSSSPLLNLQSLTLRSPDGSATLVEDLSLEVSFPSFSVICFPD